MLCLVKDRRIADMWKSRKGGLTGMLLCLAVSGVWMAKLAIQDEPSWLDIPAVAILIISGLAGCWLGSQYDRLKALAEKDSLTGTYNRRFIATMFPKLTSLVDRRRTKIGVIMIDINDFKKVNDTHGHKAGDSVLLQISKLLIGVTRNTDFVVRWGGDEFLIITPDIQGDCSDKIIQRFEESLEASSICKQWKIGITSGSALYPDEANSLEALVHLADEKMYQSKQTKKTVR